MANFLLFALKISQHLISILSQQKNLSLYHTSPFHKIKSNWESWEP